MKHDVERNVQELLRPAGGGVVNSAALFSASTPQEQLRVQTSTVALVSRRTL